MAVRTFQADEPFFLGHFPDRPVVPAVVLIEGLAQAMAYHSLFHRPSRQIFLVGIDQARFRSPIGFGVEVTFEVHVGEQRFGLTKGRGEVKAAAQHVASATLLGLCDGAPREPGDSWRFIVESQSPAGRAGLRLGCQLRQGRESGELSGDAEPRAGEGHGALLAQKPFQDALCGKCSSL